MGKLRSGILGPVSGKVSGVVGATWKGVPYLRGYAVPSPSNTDAQDAQRTDFKIAVRAAKPFVGPVFNQYSDRFISKRSGFNKFVSDNIKSVVGGLALPLPIVTQGPLYQGSELVGTYTTGTGQVVVEWNTEKGVDGADTDVAVSWMRNGAIDAVVFGALKTRVDGTCTIIDASFAGKDLEDLECGVFFAKMNDALVVKISSSLVAACVA
jgi:hypothetical protein